MGTIVGKIADLLVLSGAAIFIVAFFIFLGIFAGMMALSGVLVIIGLILGKISSNSP